MTDYAWDTKYWCSAHQTAHTARELIQGHARPICSSSATDTYGLTADDWSQLESAQAEARKVRADHPKLTQGDAVKSILTARFAAHELRLRSFDRIMRYLDNDTAHDRARKAGN